MGNVNDIPTTDEKTVDFMTDCFGCVFSKMKQKTQVGCKFHNRLSFYQEKGLAQIVETDETQNYAISTVCFAKRGDTWNHAKKTMAGKVEAAEKEIRSRITASYIVIVKDNAELIKSASHIASLKNKPTEVVFLYLSTLPDIKTFLKIDNTFKIHIPVDKQNVPDAIDSIVKNIKTSHYVIWSDSLPTEDYFIKFQNVLIYTVDKVLCWQPKKDSWDGIVVNTHVHNVYHGNANIHIFDKIKEAAEYQGNTEAYRCGPLH